MKINKEGIDFIKKYEGFSLTPYVCPAGVITVGWGSTTHINTTPIKLNEIFDLEKLEAMINRDLTKSENIVNTKVTAKLTQNQFNMLVSHTYNTGGSSSLFQIINDGKDVKDWWITRYITGNGKILKGLQKRRLEEYLIYLR